MKKIIFALPILPIFFYLVDTLTGSKILPIFTLPSSIITFFLYGFIPKENINTSIIDLNYPQQPWWSLGILVTGTIQYLFIMFWLIEKNKKKQDPSYEKKITIKNKKTRKLLFFFIVIIPIPLVFLGYINQKEISFFAAPKKEGINISFVSKKKIYSINQNNKPNDIYIIFFNNKNIFLNKTILNNNKETTKDLKEARIDDVFIPYKDIYDVIKRQQILLGGSQSISSFRFSWKGIHDIPTICYLDEALIIDQCFVE